MLKEILLVFAGGGVGSVLRWLFGRVAAAHIGATAFPWGTFAVNALGCLLIGVFSAQLVRGCLPDHLRLLLIVGLCGGMTTFSTFSNESVALLRGGHYAMFCLYVAGSVSVGLLAVILGHKIVCG